MRTKQKNRRQEPPDTPRNSLKKNEEIMTNSFLYDLVNQMYLNTDRQTEAPKDKIFEGRMPGCTRSCGKKATA
ncbi:MAG: hypothetical protein V8S26_00915 [Lachnospiraceae bacterium]